MLEWLSALALACCGLPLLFEAVRRRRCDLSWGFLALWGLGEVGMLVATLRHHDPALWLNYGGNALIVGALAWYRRP